jgi:hypothetical protein
VMRSSFGDYRTKMAEEEKKLSKGWSLPPKWRFLIVACSNLIGKFN